MKAIPALSRDKASLWLRAFKSLPEEDVGSIGVAKALKKSGGFTGLADKQAAQKKGAVKDRQRAKSGKSTPAKHSAGLARANLHYEGAKLQPHMLVLGKEVNFRAVVTRVDPLELRAVYPQKARNFKPPRTKKG